MAYAGKPWLTPQPAKKILLRFCQTTFENFKSPRQYEKFWSLKGNSGSERENNSIKMSFVEMR
jgi:hypothetical protein